MSSRVGDVIPFSKKVLEEFRAENVTFMAGSIAYQAFASLLPLLILLFFVIATVGDQQLASQATSLTQSFLPRSAQSLLSNAITGSAGSAGASVIGLVTLLWGSLKIFRGLDTAFSDIYDTEAENSFVDQITDGLVVFATIGLAIIAAGVATTAFAYFDGIPFFGFVTPLVLIAGLTVAFFPIYYLFPDMDLSVREVLPGVIVAAVGWAALQAIFQVYVAFSSKTDAYGVLGAILLLLTWLYFGGLVLLLGAVVNSVIAGRTGDMAASTDTETAEGGIIAPEQSSEYDGHHQVKNEIKRGSFARILSDTGVAFEGSGEAQVSVGTDTVVLHPPDQLTASIEARETSEDDDDGQSGLLIKAQWPQRSE